MSPRILTALAVLACCTFSPLRADEPAAPANEDYSALIKNLDSDLFQTRQAATKKLVEAGKAAINEVAKAAEGDSLEVTTRAVEILKANFKSEDKATAEAAEAALKKLADSSNSAAARRASAVLEKPVAQQQPNFRGIPIQGIQAIQGIIQNNVRIQRRVNNGETVTEVEEDGKKIKIEENKDGITVTVTEKVEGKEQTKTYKAKDAAELKKNHPEGHKLYEEYGKQQVGGAARIQIQIGGAQIRPLPARILPIGPGQVPNADQARKQIEEATKRIEKALEAIQKDANAPAELIKRLTEELEGAKKQLGEAAESLK